MLMYIHVQRWIILNDVKERLLAYTRSVFAPALRPGDFLVPWGLVFGHRGPGTAAQVVVDVALAVANSATELAIPAPGTLDAFLRQEALAEALGRLRRRKQAIRRFACGSGIHLCSSSPLGERRRPVTVIDMAESAEPK